MSRYVDFYLIGELVDSHGNVHYEDLKNLPAADVVPMEFHERCMELEIKKRANMVEVIRCRDCTWWKSIFSWNGKEHKVCVRESSEPPRESDDYCSYGERREDDKG